MPTLDSLLDSPACDLSDPIGLATTGEFRWGNLQAILYDPHRADIFQQPFLYSLYESTRSSGQRHPLPLDLTNHATLGLLPTLFCGMTNLGPDAVTSYLAQRAVCVLGEWRGEVFSPLGYCFPSSAPIISPQSLTSVPSNSVFAGYTIFSEVWRKPQQLILSYLGLAWLFHTFKLAVLHGSRVPANHLTRRWVEQFGFRDCGTMPCAMAGEPGGSLVPGVFSALLRADFEARLREVLVKSRELMVSPSASNP